MDEDNSRHIQNAYVKYCMNELFYGTGVGDGSTKKEKMAIVFFL
jgi:hypothetical protein